MLTDSHAHLTHEGIKHELILAHLERAKEAGLTRIINIATTPEELRDGLKLKQQFPWIDHVASTTPHDVEKYGEKHFEIFEEHAKNGDLVAVGETGLDYYYDHSPRDLQQQFLIRYFDLATQCDLPVVIHCRDAFADFFKILDRHFKGKGVLHCFTGNLEEAKQVVERGWYLSLSGIVTFKRSLELQEVAKMVPLEQLLIETDAPYLAPHPLRGKPNEPAYIVHTARLIADLKGLTYEELAKATAQNAADLFK